MTKDPERALGGKIGNLRKDLRKTKGGFLVGCLFLAALLALAWNTDAWTSYSIIVPGILTTLGILFEVYAFVRISHELSALSEERDQLQNKTSELIN